MLIGAPRRHTIEEGETLLDIARKYDLGINEIQDLYPHLDPWIPPVGMELQIPSQWILPETLEDGIVINVAELRLYCFIKKHSMVKTFPIGIGGREWATPLGIFRIGEKRVKPTWFIPPSLQKKYGVKAVPPGPDNPLGDYWIGLQNYNYGLHGTDIPWSVGRMVTRGCIRLYPEDMERLFKLVKTSAMVKIIYEPVKIGLCAGRYYAEVHNDIYNRIEDFVNYGLQRLIAECVAGKVDLDKFYQALARQDGMPVDITLAGSFFRDPQTE
jgi:L,D-transpeptidase ErfK/SrfK